VTYEDGSITTIEGKWSIDIPYVLTFHNVLFINGLKANLLSISQFHDENHNVLFSKDECNIYSLADKWIIKRIRTLDNCYRVSTLTTLGCHKLTLNDTNLWHQRFGYINFKDLSKIFKRKAVSGLPNLRTIKKMACKACRERKQTKA